MRFSFAFFCQQLQRFAADQDTGPVRIHRLFQYRAAWGIGRVASGIDAVRLQVFRGGVAGQKDTELSCCDVSNTSARAVVRIGLVVRDECSATRIGFWKTSANSANSQFAPTL